MSASNIGISQLQALQLRNLLGPAGIGHVNNYNSNITQRVPIISNTANYISPFTVPSGTGIIKIRIDTLLIGQKNSRITFLEIFIGQSSQFHLPYGLSSGQATYEGLLLYDNPSPTPATIGVMMRLTNTSSVTITFFQINVISFGPYVQQE
jgi:hypothetical protein